MEERAPIIRAREEFVRGLSTRLQRLRAGFDRVREAHDEAVVKAFYLEVHRLVGAAGSFGAGSIVDEARPLEELARRWDEGGAIGAEALAAASRRLDRLGRAVIAYVAAASRHEAG